MTKHSLLAFLILSLVVSCGGENPGKKGGISPLNPIPGTPSKPNPPSVPKPPATPPVAPQPPVVPPVQPTPVLPPVFTPDPLKIHSYKLVHKIWTVTNDERLFHQLEVDKGAGANYEVLYKNTILDPLLAYNRVVCSAATAQCEVQSLQNDGAYGPASISNVVVTEDATTNKRKIEFLDPTFKDYKDGNFIAVQAAANGKKSSESLAKVGRE